MKQILNNRKIVTVCISVYFLILLSISAGCLLKNVGRSYEQQPFDSKKWRDGDDIERGTMVVDLHRNRIIQGKTSQEVLVLLGAPDNRTSNEGLEVWLYKVKNSGVYPRNHFPVSFDKDGKAFVGGIKNGTTSLVTH